MNCKRNLAFAIPALSLLLVLSAQQAGTEVGWYNGEWRSGVPGLPNWYATADRFARVYDQFQVPDGGWTVAAVFSDNGSPDPQTIVNASWEIRRGMAPGDGGEIVASGVAPAVQAPDPSVTAKRYPAAEVPRHFRITVENMRLFLPAGHYWLSVTPLGDEKLHVSATAGGNAVGLDGNGPGMALFDSPGGPRFAIAEATGRAGQVGVARHFSQGVIVAR